MQEYRVFGPGIPGFARRAFAASLLCWMAAALVFAAAESSSLKIPATVGAYWVAAGFAGVAVASAALGTSGFERTFWLLLGGGLLLRFAGHFSWTGFHLSGLYDPRMFAPHDLLHAVSYLLLIGAMLWLTTRITRRAAPLAKLGVALAALDVIFVIFSVGSLVWYFVLEPAAGDAGIDTAREVFSALRRPAFDAGLLFLSLAILSTTRRPPYAVPLVAAFGVFLIADTVYIHLRSSGPYEIGNWPEILWALGIGCLGVAAMRSGHPARMQMLGIKPRSVFLFWCGPLSPALHFGVLLIWGFSNPPIPYYVMVGAVALLLYVSLRISVLAYVDQRLAREMEDAARRGERSRIAEELHDTLKQTVHSIPVMLRAYEEASKSGEKAEAKEILARIVESSREASYQISRPVWELRDGLAPEMLVGKLLEDIGKGFAIETHSDMRASLEKLNPDKLTAAYHIAAEAIWNAAKHSGAKNIWFETSEEDASIIVRVRDDGRGFSTKDSPSGLGLTLMRNRAEAVGGTFAISSETGEGTTVQARFERG